MEAKRYSSTTLATIDSAYEHLVWIQDVKEKLGTKIPFPIVEDLSMNVANAYGMIHPGSSETSAVRSPFIIDREGILRTMIYYPKDNGRSIREILRLLKALQTTDQHKVATPEGWLPGDRVVVPPPQTTENADTRLAAAEAAGYECVDWYLCTRPL